MKRASWIVGIVLAVAVAVGAFVIGGSDGSSEAKSPSTSASSSNSTKSAANKISGATKVQSLPPLEYSGEGDLTTHGGKGGGCRTGAGPNDVIRA